MFSEIFNPLINRCLAPLDVMNLDKSCEILACVLETISISLLLTTFVNVDWTFCENPAMRRDTSSLYENIVVQYYVIFYILSVQFISYL